MISASSQVLLKSESMLFMSTAVVVPQPIVLSQVITDFPNRILSNAEEPI